MPNPAHTERRRRFGAYIFSATKIDKTCDWHATEHAVTGKFEGYPTGHPYDRHSVIIEGEDHYGRPRDAISSVVANSTHFGGIVTLLRRNRTHASVHASLGDIVWFDKPGAAPDEITDIPVELCFSYSTIWTPETSTIPGGSAANATIQIKGFNYQGYASQDGYDLDTQIKQVENGQWVEEQCNEGVFRMAGPGAAYSLRLLLNNTGQKGVERHIPTNSAITTIEGSMIGSFRIASLPDDVICTSASDDFPGCKPPVNPNEPLEDFDACWDKQKEIMGIVCNLFGGLEFLDGPIETYNTHEALCNGIVEAIKLGGDQIQKELENGTQCGGGFNSGNWFTGYPDLVSCMPFYGQEIVKPKACDIPWVSFEDMKDWIEGILDGDIPHPDDAWPDYVCDHAGCPTFEP